MRITPAQLRPRADRVVTRLPDVFTNWRWCRRLGHDRLKVSDEAKVRGASSNEVESITLGQQVIRDLVRRGEKAFYQAIVEFEKADYYFEEALKRGDNRSPRIRETDLKNEPWVSHKERRHLLRAQGKRRERAEDVP